MDQHRIILVAMTEDRIIGHEGRMPWHLPEELRLFRELTMGHTVLMGRRTFESIGRPLPGRRNIVLSRSLEETEGIAVCRDLPSAMAAGEAHGRDIFIIGGAQVYGEALPLVDLMRISWVEGRYPGDVRFPSFDRSEWEEIESRQHPGFRHVLYRRVGPLPSDSGTAPARDR